MNFRAAAFIYIAAKSASTLFATSFILSSKDFDPSIIAINIFVKPSARVFWIPVISSVSIFKLAVSTAAPAIAPFASSNLVVYAATSLPVRVVF